MSDSASRFPNEELILEACDKLVDFHAWDGTKIDPRGWLANFDQTDRGFALVLLSRFTFLSDHLVDQLFRAAFHNLSNGLHATWESFQQAKVRWRAFYDEAIVTIVQDEEPNPSDSGWLFARKARQVLGIAERQLLEPSDVIQRLANGFRGPVIFVDDFVGSGEQFLATWERTHQVGASTESFRSLVQSECEASFYYCNAMTTEAGRDRLFLEVPRVRLSTGNLIPKSHSLISSDSALWPPGMKDDGIRLVEKIGRSLGYTANDGGKRDWRGFHKLGLGIAFAHSMPDANLPLFFAEERGWTPLVRRL